MTGPTRFAEGPACRRTRDCYCESLPDGIDFTGRTAGSVGAMKVRASVKRMCEKCKLIRRKGVVRVICADPRHKQRQG